MNKNTLRFWDLYLRVNDDFAWFDQYANPTASTWTVRGQFVDTDKFDVTVTPKESYKKELITQKEKELESLDKKREELRGEIKKLKE